jgi:hypothetical protein
MSESLIHLIIKEEFGEIGALIVNLILQNGELSVIELVSQSKLSFDEVKHSLVVLIKHNIVYFVNKANLHNTEDGQAPKDLIEDFVYCISIQDVLHRLRYCSYF